MVQEVTTKSWGSRIVSAFWGVIIGIILICASFYLIFWNEGHGLHTAQSLEQTEQVIVKVANAPIDAKNNLQVVYFSGMASTTETLKDNLFGIAENAIKLQRTVLMYQWKENTETRTEKNVGGSETEVKTYTYEQVWSQDLIPSKDFKEQTGHQNPGAMPLKSKDEYAKTVTVGDYKLPRDLIRTICGATPIDLSKVDLAAVKAKLNKPIVQSAEELYVGATPDAPSIGDLRVTLSEVLPQTVSVIGQQTDNTLQAYIAPAGQPVILLAMGQQSSQQMIQDAQSENRMMTWIWRVVSLAMMIIGFALLVAPIAVIADFIPFLGTLVGFGTGLIAFTVGFGLWALGTAIAWFTVRPLWSIGLIAIAILIGYLLLKKKKSA